MIRRQRVFILSLAGIVVLGVLLSLWIPREPRYQGKPLSFWIGQLYVGEQGDPQAREEARRALRSIADKAVPRLIDVLTKKDSPLKQAINRLSNESPLGENLLRPASSDKGWAAHVLGEIGPPALAAVPALVEVSQDGKGIISVNARAALMKIRREAVLPLVQDLTDTTSANWRRAAFIVGELAEGATPAIPVLLKNLDDDNWKVRLVAAMTLGHAHVGPELCIPALVRTLKDTNALVRMRALDSLLRFGPARKEVVAATIEALKDSDVAVRMRALEALEEHVPAENAKAAVPFVVAACRGIAGRRCGHPRICGARVA